MTLWTSAEAIAATGGTCAVDWQATGVSIDTRTIAPGDIFVALTVARDGHDFVAQALAKGAAAALVSRIPEGVAADAPLLIVPDVQTALEALGRHRRAQTQARVLAVTGSVGKTSTKEMLATMLAGQGRTHASVASYNNHWGVPLTLARMPKDTDFAVIEIGMNHPGEIAPLARMARPHVAMVTTVAPAHLEAFENIDGIAREKAAIFDGLEPGGTAIVNGDLDTTPILLEAAQGHSIRRFGEFPENDMRAIRIETGSDHVRVEAMDGDAPLDFVLTAQGRHFALNALGALAAVQALGADLTRAAADLPHWSEVTGRGARETIVLASGGRLDLIDDAYNANPASVAASLSVLAEARMLDGSPPHRRIAILGDMKELGPQEAALHGGLAENPAMMQIAQVHTVGPLMAHLHAALPMPLRGGHAATSAELATALAGQLKPDDLVLVKGSLSMQMARIVDAIRKMGHPRPNSETQDNA